MDTVTFRTKERKPSAFVLRDLGFTKPFDGAGQRWFWKPPAGSHLPRINWISSQSGDYLTVFEASLPNLLYGNNVQIIDTNAEAMRAVDALSILASDITGVDCDLRRWDVTRLDPCHVWKLNGGETEVYARIDAVGNVHINNMELDPRYKHGMYWKNKSETILAYSKRSDISEQMRKGKQISGEILLAADGEFRLERRYLDRAAIERHIVKPFGLANLHAENVLRFEIMNALINEVIMKLKLNEPLVSGDTRKARLLEQYGFTNKYFRLRTFLDDYSNHQMRQRMIQEMNAETFRNYRKELEAAGVLLDNPQSETYAALTLAGHCEALVTDVVSIAIQSDQNFLGTPEWLN